MQARTLLPCLLLGLTLPLAQAQAQASQARTTLPGTAPLPADDRLYRELGGRESIQRFTDDFYAPPRVGPSRRAARVMGAPPVT